MISCRGEMYEVHLRYKGPYAVLGAPLQSSSREFSTHTEYGLHLTKNKMMILHRKSRLVVIVSTIVAL